MKVSAPGKGLSVPLQIPEAFSVSSRSCTTLSFASTVSQHLLCAFIFSLLIRTPVTVC